MVFGWMACAERRRGSLRLGAAFVGLAILGILPIAAEAIRAVISAARVPFFVTPPSPMPFIQLDVFFGAIGRGAMGPGALVWACSGEAARILLDGIAIAWFLRGPSVPFGWRWCLMEGTKRYARLVLIAGLGACTQGILLAIIALALAAAIIWSRSDGSSPLLAGISVAPFALATFLIGAPFVEVLVNLARTLSIVTPQLGLITCFTKAARIAADAPLGFLLLGGVQAAGFCAGVLLIGLWFAAEPSAAKVVWYAFFWFVVMAAQAVVWLTVRQGCARLVMSIAPLRVPAAHLGEARGALEIR
ncbi:MAG: hypothetical protein WDM91_22505 [Rhizomicrobium sp.]